MFARGEKPAPHRQPTTRNAGKLRFERACVMPVLSVLLGWATDIRAEPYFDPEGPFVQGEGFPTIPATCETIDDWIDRAPDYDGRISMSITGTLEESHWDGALAYLVMCAPEAVQVMCVTYYPFEGDPDEPLLLAGGYMRVGAKQIMLDPCLAYDAE
jgi:hypothetical protein